MIRVNLIVEGQTEEAFVNQILADALALRNVFLSARRVETSRNIRAGKIFRGGLVGYQKARKDIERWLKQDPSAYLTTMFDLYGLPQDFPGFGRIGNLPDAYNKAGILEAEMYSDLNNQRFIPHVQLHEFEALLLSDVSQVAGQLGLSVKDYERLHNDCASFESPEHINDNPDTAPSKRILSVYPPYEKLADGLKIAHAIGLDTMREKCRHFNEWLTRLEALGE